MAKEIKVSAKLETEEQKKIRRLRESIRDSQKEIKALKEAQKMEDSINRWKEITGVKKDVINLIKKAESTRGFSLKKLMTMADYYTLQNPNNTKQKGSDENADWVQKYVKSGGSISTLIDTANKSRPTAWKKITGRKKTVKKKTTSTTKSYTRKLG